MKTSQLLAALAIVLSLVSCKKGNDSRLPENNNIQRKFLVEKLHYTGTSVSTDYVLYAEDPVKHIIYAVIDSVTDSYESRHFDATGRLEKIVLNNINGPGPTSRDSVLITRPGANTTQWVFSPGMNIPTQTVTITDLGSSRKLLTIRQAGDDPAVYYEKLYFNTMGSLDSIIRWSHTGTPGDVDRFKRELFYNSNHAPVTQVVTVSQSSSPYTHVTTSAITRDNHENAYLHVFLDKLNGTDLIWLSYDAFRGSNPVFQSDFTDRVMLLNGTLLTISSNTKQYNNGVFETDMGTYLLEYSFNYDIQGRIITADEEGNGQLITSTQIEYFD